MNDALVPAVGIALSPLPILAIALLLGGRRGLTAGFAFWVAWIAAVAAATTALVVVVDSAGTTDGNPAAIAVAELVLGALFLAFAARLAVGRRAAREGTPAWLKALDRGGSGRAAALALLLSCANPKNVALILAGAIAIAEGEGTGSTAVGMFAFVGIAACGVSVPLVARMATPQRSGSAIAALRRLLARHDRTLALVVALALGAYFAGDGLAGLRGR